MNELFRLVQSSKDGIETDHITALTPALTSTQKQMAINSLLSSKRLVLIKEGSILKLKVNESTQLEGVTEEEQAVRFSLSGLFLFIFQVYSLIEESQTKGIWIKELRDNTGLAVSQMRKVLKSLENKKLIKTVKVSPIFFFLRYERIAREKQISTNYFQAVGTTKKCYMLTSFEPDTSLTGGTFYSDHQLDSELIHTLVSVCTSFLQSKRKTAVDQFPNDSGMQKELSYVRPQEVPIVFKLIYSLCSGGQLYFGEGRS